jgi:VCBS repeat-containing protein
MTWASPRIARKPRPRRRMLLLAPLEDRCVPAGNLWAQRGGDAGHTGYADVNVNAAAITPAWSQTIAYGSSGYWDQNGNRGVAIDGSRVYRTELEGYWASGNYHVMAFDLQTGSPVWNRVIVGNGPVSAPSVGTGYVYVNRSGHSGISGGTSSELPYLAALDPQTGATVRFTNYSAQWESDERPVLGGTQVIDYDGYYGGISSWDATSLGRQWNRTGWQSVPLAAALDSQYVYAYGNMVFNRSTGATVRTVTGPAGYPWVADPMVSPSGKVFYEVRNDQNYPNQWALSAYTAGGAAPVWTTPLPNAPGGEAVGNGVVAVTADGKLHILDEATGAVRQTWTAPTSYGTSYLSPQIVLTRTHAFVQVDGYLYGPSTVYAVNLVTGQAEWSYTNAQRDENSYTRMEVAVGGGKLILSHDGFVKAFDLPDQVNAAPNAADDAATTAEDTAATIGVLANDTDPDGDALAVTAVGTPAHGTARLNADGTITYTPAANYNGLDSFTYTIGDGHGGSDTATVSLTVTPVNDPPVAGPDGYALDEDQSLSVPLAAGVLANDTDTDGDPLSATLGTGPTHAASFNLNADGSFTYTPAANYNGADSFTYTVSDGHGGTATGTVPLTVRPVNDLPAAAADAYTVNEDTALTVPAATGVLANDTDADGDALTAVLVGGPAHGSLALNPDGSFAYTPAANYYGTDSFTYKPNDGTGDGNTVTVALTVNPVNDAPSFVPGANQTVAEDSGPRTVAGWATGISAGPANEAGQALTFVVVGNSNPGLFSAGPAISPTGTLTFTPAPDAYGTATVQVRLRDDGGTANGGVDQSPIQTFTITVTPLTQVAAVTVNQGAVQRSMVTKVVVTFDGIVTLDAGAFTMTGTSRTGSAQSVQTIAVTTAVVDGRTVATLSFSGRGTDQGSLADGLWTLRVIGSKVHDTRTGLTMAADYTYGLHRLFGDANGDRRVDSVDKAAFDAAYGTRRGQAGYVDYFDFDNNGYIERKDRDQFNSRYGASL